MTEDDEQALSSILTTFHENQVVFHERLCFVETQLDRFFKAHAANTRALDSLADVLPTPIEQAESDVLMALLKDTFPDVAKRVAETPRGVGTRQLYQRVAAIRRQQLEAEARKTASLEETKSSHELSSIGDEGPQSSQTDPLGPAPESLETPDLPSQDNQGP